MSRFTVLLGLLVAMVAVYGGDEDQCCGDNESWNLCGKLCEPSCQTPVPRVCPKIACSNFTAACRCDSGYVRDTTDNSCVLLEDCQSNEDQY
ncbi:chymotrypsin inhibitor-like [Andrena cerasifolii]|uniref:chymotrypsin inhibitor-like n=1 Tax=Andrena cerasifolii TaxID=2819439 RepID=UPI0040376ED3